MLEDRDVRPDAAAGDGRRVSIAERLRARAHAHAQALSALVEQAETLDRVVATLLASLRSGKKVLLAGNGGSAAEAQHFSAELVGRFKRERAPYAAIALTTDSSILTAVANDYGYGEVFARQVAALGQEGDVLITYSTSGESENLLRAAETARDRGMSVVAVTGSRASDLQRAADLAVRTPGADTANIQELHMVITHLLCDLVESALAEQEASRPE
jgi:D-sedoheptulose 7-phosphate isomerase